MKSKKFSDKIKKVLVIVAHPDDETIWMGGTILQHPEWNWTIFSLCRSNDADRAPKFQKVCEYYRAKSVISNLDDETDKPLHSAPYNSLLQQFGKEKYDFIFTHGENGEYGHVRHKDVHKAVKQLVKEGKLQTSKLYFFDYVPGNEKAPHDSKLKIPIPNPRADLIVKLTKKQHEEKVGIITKMYGFIPPIFETLACAREEAFRKFGQ